MDMLELTIKSFVTIYIIKLILQHNLFISKLTIKIKFLGIHIELHGKEKKHPSDKE
ncbi:MULTISPECIES: hypothetical protein [Clostridium]|uniref:hypothetical protein n=1 Tax=Clostridium TaxID=1485 RepID=UPI00024BB168|nr:hypothetical protein [Clostridium sporogenes]KEI74938.1 membrane protein [Clostridium botulinum B2 128]KEI88664.1 membrane protein [Clostridium botulinum B2 433]HDK7167897.1 hypothetical protein [Clostridium botulinum]AKJ88804.1 membrane protein [Clostridium sporogenes]EHN15248.1 hypothetical protein IYC_10259 [Clostridium sporogenes PA 3679]